MTVFKQWLIRPATLADMTDAYPIHLACDVADYGTSFISYAGLQALWQSATVRLSTESWVVTTPAGRIVSYALTNYEAAAHGVISVYVPPALRSQGLGTHLLGLAEAQLTQTPGAIAECRVADANGAAQHVLARAGYVRQRGYVRMAIDLTRPAPDAILAQPTGQPPLVITPFLPGQDEAAVYRAHEAAFLDAYDHVPTTFAEWSAGHVANAGFDPGLCFVGRAEGEIAGLIMGWRRGANGWIGPVAVTRAYRGRGLALALVQRLFTAFSDEGITHVGLSVDAANRTGANRVYARAGMQPTQTYATYTKSAAVVNG